jgi:hypothetical protein
MQSTRSVVDRPSRDLLTLAVVTKTFEPCAPAKYRYVLPLPRLLFERKYHYCSCRDGVHFFFRKEETESTVEETAFGLLGEANVKRQEENTT